VTLPLISAGMMELVDMRDLGSRAVMRWGSSPHARTKKNSCILRQTKRSFCFSEWFDIMLYVVKTGES